MAFCEHSTYLSTVHSVAYHGADVQSSKVALLFRPGMIFSLVLTASCSTLQHVKIALEGSVEGLKGAIWTHDKKGDDLIFLEDVQLNENYWIALSPNSRVFCRVWTDECPFFECKLAQQQAAHKKELQTLRSQLKQSETRLIEQRWRAENSQKALESRIQQLEQEAADNERKLATAVDENDSFKQQMEESLAKISELTAALEEQKAAGEAAAAETLAASKALENEVVKKEVRIDSLKDQLTKQREGAKKTKQQLRSHIQAMEEKMVDKKRNYVSVISSLESKCEGLQKEAKIAAKSRAELVDRCALLENEVSELKSALSDEQARAEIEAERKERADELATLHEKLASVEKAKETLEEEIECMRSQVFNFKPVGDGERQDAVGNPPLVPAEFSSWREEGYVTDFRLVVDNEMIPVHRNVLALKSAFFFKFFRAHPQAAELLVDGFSAHTIGRLVDFCYGNEMGDLSGDAGELYSAARHYEVSDLLAACVKSMKASITTENAADLFILAFGHKDREMGDFAIDFADANGGKFGLLGAAPVQAFKNEPATFKKIWEWINYERVDGGQSGQRQPLVDDESQLPRALQSAEDNADDQSDSTSSSEFERIDAQ